jgi:hypothetical protein
MPALCPVLSDLALAPVGIAQHARELVVDDDGVHPRRGRRRSCRRSVTPPRAGGRPDDFLAGRLPRSLIERVVNASYNRIRMCHGAGLPSSRDLSGEVIVAFVISPRGAVVEAHDAGGQFDDQAVRRCVVAAFSKLSFPPPRNGEAQQVSYPVALDPGDLL